MSSSLDKVLALAATVPADTDLESELLFAAQVATGELYALLAATEDDDGDDDDDDDDDGKGGDDDWGGHADHATFKAMKKRGVPSKRAAAMCARSDKNVKATALARSLGVMLSGKPGQDISLVTLTPASETAEGRRKAAKAGHALPDGSYPIEDVKHLHSAATLAASGHGNVSAAKALIRKRARELGVDVNTLPGFGGSDEDNEKAAASMVALAKAATGGVPFMHPPFTGTHSHAHNMTAVHEHDHQHVNDNRHDGGPLHRPGSQRREMW